ncbi:MAG: discoidin domain-containing protein [Muribaculaceae bacterium]|nr:discoidin domain-containing protein [Muribaculaceae bacterium]
MKKTLLLSVLLAVIGLAIPSTAQAAGKKLAKTGWIVTVDSEEHKGEGTTNGRANCLIDDNTNTYWHTCWSEGKGEVNGKCPHFIALDLGSDQTFHTVELIDRNNTGTNGRVTACSIYVSSCPIEYADSSTWGGLVKTASNLPTGQAKAKQVELGSNITARYLIIKITGSTGNETDKWACVSELNLYGPADYTTGLESVTTNNTGNRKTTQLTVADNNSHTLTISNLQNGNGSPVVIDRSTEAITVEPGAVITLTAANNISWMHQYAYVDWDGDGFLYTDATSYFTSSTSTTLKDGSELVAFDYYSGKNSAGADKGSGSGCNDPISFTIPENTQPGAYRARYKVD